MYLNLYHTNLLYRSNMLPKIAVKVLAISPVSLTRKALPGKAFGSHSASAPSPIAMRFTLTLGFEFMLRLRSSGVIP